MTLVTRGIAERTGCFTLSGIARVFNAGAKTEDRAQGKE